MKTIVGMIGITLIGIGVGIIAFGTKTGLCMGIAILGLGLVIDAIRK